MSDHNSKVNLCGCFIPEKSKWSLERCPINKWGYYRLNEDEARELGAFISGLPTDGKLSGVTVRLAADWVYKMTGRRVSCASCNAKALINYLRSETGRLDVIWQKYADISLVEVFAVDLALRHCGQHTLRRALFLCFDCPVVSR